MIPEHPLGNYVLPELRIESVIDEAISRARKRWEKEGRTQNRFSSIIDELERVMFTK